MHTLGASGMYYRAIFSRLPRYPVCIIVVSLILYGEARGGGRGTEGKGRNATKKIAKVQPRKNGLACQQEKEWCFDRRVSLLCVCVCTARCDGC